MNIWHTWHNQFNHCIPLKQPFLSNLTGVTGGGCWRGLSEEVAEGGDQRGLLEGMAGGVGQRGWPEGLA